MDCKQGHARHALDPVVVLARNGLGRQEEREHDLSAAEAEQEDIAVRNVDSKRWSVLVVCGLETTHEHSDRCVR